MSINVLPYVNTFLVAKPKISLLVYNDMFKPDQYLGKRQGEGEGYTRLRVMDGLKIFPLWLRNFEIVFVNQYNLYLNFT